MNKIQQFKEITDTMNKIYEAKNSDYGDSFDKTIDEFGLTASLVRMSDKFNRIKQLVNDNNAKVKTESIKDTLLDLANYSIMTLLYITNKQ
jgi:hypothetical protein